MHRPGRGNRRLARGRPRVYPLAVGAPIHLTRAQSRELDRRAIEELGIPGCVLMENAGRGAAEAIVAARREAGPRRAAIVCGAGNNGGDGYVVARHLAIRGWTVELAALGDPARLTGDAALNHGICRAMGLAVAVLDEAGPGAAARGWARADVLVDAVLGTGFRGELRPAARATIEAMNAARGPLAVALDVPSGLDADTGRPSDATFRADLTVTFAAPKVGFLAEEAAPWLGRLVVAGIGTPPALVAGVAGV